MIVFITDAERVKDVTDCFKELIQFFEEPIFELFFPGCQLPPQFNSFRKEVIAQLGMHIYIGDVTDVTGKHFLFQALQTLFHPQSQFRTAKHSFQPSFSHLGH